jgi:Phage integrase, N-terminal SAM-like domain
MPWKECSVVEARLRFVARLLDGETMTDLCREFGISRKTGYKPLQGAWPRGPHRPLPPADCGSLAAIANGLERSTREQYRQHVELHIVPLIGVTKLNKLTLPAVRTFQDRLRENGRSPELTRKVLTSLGSLVAEA